MLKSYASDETTSHWFVLRAILCQLIHILLCIRIRYTLHTLLLIGSWWLTRLRHDSLFERIFSSLRFEGRTNIHVIEYTYIHLRLKRSIHWGYQNVMVKNTQSYIVYTVDCALMNRQERFKWWGLHISREYENGIFVSSKINKCFELQIFDIQIYKIDDE